MSVGCFHHTTPLPPGNLWSWPLTTLQILAVKNSSSTICLVSLVYPKSADHHHLLLIRAARGKKSTLGQVSNSSIHPEGSTDSPNLTQRNIFGLWEETGLLTGMKLKKNLIQLNLSLEAAGWSFVIWVFTRSEAFCLQDRFIYESSIKLSRINQPSTNCCRWQLSVLHVPTALLFELCCRGNMMYETHTVQTNSYKFAWLVNWWEVG